MIGIVGKKCGMTRVFTDDGRSVPVTIVQAHPNFINKIMNVDYLNIEYIDDKIIEIHLRTGNDILHNTPIGTEVIPIWSDEKNTSKELEKQGYEFKSNLHPDSFSYGADGHLKYVREGYMIK